MALSKQVVNSAQLCAALTCCAVTAFMMAVSTYGMMPNKLYGLVIAAATIALDGMHYLSWPMARWKIQEGRYGLASLLIFCGLCIAGFSITATSNQMIQVAVEDSVKHKAEIEVRIPELEQKTASLNKLLAQTTFIEREVSNEAQIRADIVNTRKEAMSYRQSGRMRNAEATEAVADNKESNLQRDLQGVDRWNTDERQRVETTQAEIRAQIEQAQNEILAIRSTTPRSDVLSIEVLKWLLRGFAVALVVFPSVILSSLATTAMERREHSYEVDGSSPGAPSPDEPVAQIALMPLPCAPQEVEQIFSQPAAEQPRTEVAQVAEGDVVAGEIPSNLTNLFGALEALIERAEPGDAIPIGKVAKELRVSSKSLVLVYPYARQRGLIDQNQFGHWIKPLAA